MSVRLLLGWYLAYLPLLLDPIPQNNVSAVSKIEELRVSLDDTVVPGDCYLLNDVRVSFLIAGNWVMQTGRNSARNSDSASVIPVWIGQ